MVCLQRHMPHSKEVTVMMSKKNYERATLTVVSLNAKDIITTSTYAGDLIGPIVMPDDEIF